MAIQESTSWEQKTVVELMSNLQMCEMQMFTYDETQKKEKSIAFIAEDQELVFDLEEPNDEETLALLTKNFTKILK